MASSENTRDRRESKAVANGADIGPFAPGAEYYRRLGWVDVMPIQRGGPDDKKPLRAGFNGRKRKNVPDSAIRQWLHQFPHANIAIVVPRDVICLDVDHYGDKLGGDSLRGLESVLGP